MIKERKLPRGEKWYTILSPGVVMKAVEVLAGGNPSKSKIADLLDMIVNSPNVGYENISHVPGIWTQREPLTEYLVNGDPGGLEDGRS